MFKFVFLILQILVVQISFSQRHTTRILGTIEIDRASSIDQTEVTVQEYVYFLINNDFELALFPKMKILQPSARFFFEDLQKQKILAL